MGGRHALLPCLAALCAGACAPRESAAELVPGRPAHARLAPKGPEGALFYVEVDERATGLRLWTNDATEDVELYVRRGAPPELEQGLFDAASASSWIDEELLLEVSDRLSPGRWYVLAVVASFAWYQQEAEASLELSAELLLPPVLDLLLDEPLEAVLERAAGLRASFRVALPPDAPRAGELRIEVFSPYADVDLLAGTAPDARAWRAPLAEERALRTFERLRLVFPSVALGAARLPLGTPLLIIGYPMTGGSGSMTSVTLTKGVLSGYSVESEGVIYKTDAAVHAGVSGGACIDPAGSLAGLPVASIADANAAGGLGYVIPVDRIPAAWRQRIGR